MATQSTPKRSRSRTPLAGAASATRISHFDGCPAERVESYDAVRPADRQVVTISRCIDCGASSVDQTQEQT